VRFAVVNALRAAVLFLLIYSALGGDPTGVLYCALTMFLLFVPALAERFLSMSLSDTLHILICLFSFSANILGELMEVYLSFPLWDSILHLIAGFVFAGVGLSMIDILGGKKGLMFTLRPILCAVTALCFSAATGVLWECFEYFMDVVFGMDMQKDTLLSSVTSILLNPEYRNKAVTETIESVYVNGRLWAGYIDIGLRDTMHDLLINFLGSAIFFACTFKYIRSGGKSRFIRQFIPVPAQRR